jgi:hypothetical protein
VPIVGASLQKEKPFTLREGTRSSGPAPPALGSYSCIQLLLLAGLRMSDVRIIAVSIEGGEQLEHVTHVWTVEGAMSKQRAVEDMWSGRRRYYVVLPTGRVDVAPVPSRGPNRVTAFFGHRVQGELESPRGTSMRDSLLTLPRLPSPTRPRRSRAMASQSPA